MSSFSFEPFHVDDIESIPDDGEVHNIVMDVDLDLSDDSNKTDSEIRSFTVLNNNGPVAMLNLTPTDDNSFSGVLTDLPSNVSTGGKKRISKKRGVSKKTVKAKKAGSRKKRHTRSKK